MKVSIINTFHVFNHRVSMISKYFSSKGYQVEIIGSDFNHDSKSYLGENIHDMTLIKTIPYVRNISIKRIVSHILFSKNAIKELYQSKPDFIYIILPPNILAEFVMKYKQKFPNTKIVFDIMDLWPESFPIVRFKNNIFFFKWKLLRNNNLKKADYVILECDYYSRVLEDVLPDSHSSTIHMPIKQGYYESFELKGIDELFISYLGSINNIIDMNLISEILISISKIKKVTFIIIGDGENKKKLINLFNFEDVSVIDYGKIYDSKRKFEILSKCHFALNIMKDNVEVGLTMKSLEYFRIGIPIINNIKGDSFEFVSKYNCGINVDKNIDKLVSQVTLMTLDDYNEMKLNSRKVYEEFLSDDIFLSKLHNVITNIR